ncbi:MAG: hypothetical protein COA43_08340 [Robiginitomaculum sp.]|nr:MAG: hypothetical protein COA43_08340 [Robiginitomaculum sp.]
MSTETLDLLIMIIGIAGGLFLLTPYFLVSAGKLSGQSVVYQFLNILGSSLLFINTTYHGAYPTSVVNIVWAIIGIVTLVTALRARAGKNA